MINKRNDDYINDGLIIAQNEVYVKHNGEIRKNVPEKTLILRGYQKNNGDFDKKQM